MKECFILFGDISGSDSFSASSLLHLVFSMISIALILSREMADIGDIDDMGRRIATDMLDRILEEIVDEVLTHIPEVGCPIDGRSTGVDTDIGRIDRDKFFERMREGIEEMQCHLFIDRL